MKTHLSPNVSKSNIIDEKNDLNDNYDRLKKYGLGSLRLGLLIITLIFFDKDSTTQLIRENHRWIYYIIYAIFGACVNVKIFGKQFEKIILILILILALHDLSFDCTIILYSTKTFIPDFFASKLDRKIWKFLLFISCSAFIYFLFISSNLSIFEMRGIWFIMSLTQLFCEIGDQYLEHLTFFRHRYSFEFCMLIVWYFFLPISNKGRDERRFFYYDMIGSFSYRLSGFGLKIFKLDFRKTNLKNLLDKNEQKMRLKNE